MSHPVKIELYDVCQVSRDGGKTWKDYVSIKTDADKWGAARLVDANPNRGQPAGLCYRIVRGEKVIRS